MKQLWSSSPLSSAQCLMTNIAYCYFSIILNVSMPGLSLGQTLKDFRKLLARDLATTGVIRSSPHTLQLSSTMYCIIWETSLLGFISSLFLFLCTYVKIKKIYLERAQSFSCSEFKDEESHLFSFYTILMMMMFSSRRHPPLSLHLEMIQIS